MRTVCNMRHAVRERLLELWIECIFRMRQRCRLFYDGRFLRYGRSLQCDLRRRIRI